jgi:hypothetical protein
LVQTAKSNWIFAYNKVSQRNLTRTPRTLNYARAVSLVLYKHVNDLLFSAVKTHLKTDKFWSWIIPWASIILSIILVPYNSNCLLSPV